MNIDDLYVFTYVARLGSISDTATALHLSQPAVTQIVRRLETQLGLTLFIRSRQGTTLTTAGESLFREAQLVLEQYKKFQEQAAYMAGHPARHVTIATYPSVVSNQLASWMETMDEHQRLQHVQQYNLTIREGSYDEVHQWALSGSAQLVITAEQQRIQGFHATSLLEDEYVLVCSRAIPAPVGLEDLSQYRFVMPLSGCKEWIAPYVRHQGLRMQQVMEVETIHSTLAMTKALEGITILPANSLSEDWQRYFYTQALPDSIRRSLLIQWAPQHHSDPLLMQLVDQLHTFATTSYTST